MKSIHRSSELLLLDGPPYHGWSKAHQPPRQRILLSDFGIVRHTDDISGLTGTNMTMGTIGYTAPAYHLLTGTQSDLHAIEFVDGQALAKDRDDRLGSCRELADQRRVNRC
jgi:hypothetical protein